MLRFKHLLAALVLLAIHCAYGGDNFMLGNEAFQQGDYPKALELYTEGLKQRESAEEEFNLGNTYYMMGKNGSAILHYMRGLLLDPRDGDIKTNLKLVRERRGLR